MTINNEKAADFSDYNERQMVVDDLTKELDLNWEEALVKLRQYENYESEDLKRDIYAFVWRVGIGLDDTKKKQQLVQYLLDGAVKGTPFIQGQALKFLMDFGPADFNQQSVTVLSSLSWDTDYGVDIIRLIGIVNVQTKIPELRKLAGTVWEDVDPIVFYASRQWAAVLALARMGDPVSTDRIIQKVRSEPDIIVRTTELFQDLAYTKQPAAFDALRFYLRSEKRLPQVKKTVPGRLESIYAATMFAKYVNGCPIKGEDVDESDVVKIREWADRQTEWDIQ